MRGNWFGCRSRSWRIAKLVEVERFDAQQGAFVLLDPVQPLGLRFPPLLDDRFPVGFLGHLGAVFDPGVHVLPRGWSVPSRTGRCGGSRRRRRGGSW